MQKIEWCVNQWSLSYYVLCDPDERRSLKQKTNKQTFKPPQSYTYTCNKKYMHILVVVWEGYCTTVYKPCSSVVTMIKYAWTWTGKHYPALWLYNGEKYSKYLHFSHCSCMWNWKLAYPQMQRWPLEGMDQLVCNYGTGGSQYHLYKRKGTAGTMV